MITVRRVVILLLIAACAVTGQTVQHDLQFKNAGQQQITIPETAPTIPRDFSERMTRQEQRLDDIYRRLDAIDKAVENFNKSMSGIQAQMSVVDFVMGVLKLFIPGIILTWFGFWYSDRLKKRTAHS